jgi:UDP-hydrolysing UDP-N-acetyl-D-glucosamine 2-epimerase
MANPRTIAVVTGTRAEFGLLASVMRAIADQPTLQLRTVVTGTHLTAGTWQDVRDAGFTIDAKVPMQRRGDPGRAADVAALGRGVTGLGEAFGELKPDVVLVLGDRIEALAGACAASVGGLLVAHVHGGDRAEGVADEAMRHAITKLAHLHFPATTQSRRRIIRMGEDPARVFNHGSPAIDALRDVQPDTDSPDAPELIVLQHPIDAGDPQESRWMRDTLAATRGYARLVLMPNHDPGRGGIARAIEQHAGKEAVEHLPRPRFLSLLAGAKAIVGNSSAGLIEAAALRVPCVNVGPRQAGREKPGNVVDCDYGKAHVAAALDAALKVDRQRLRHPYGRGESGPRIAQTLGTIKLGAVARRKRNRY